MDTASLLREAQERYETFKAKNLSLNMTRGKPSPQQLDLANPMLDLVTGDSYRDDLGTDCRNYGVLDGLPEMKAIFADFLEVRPEEVIIGGNASLNLMYDTFMKAMVFGLPGGDKPWKDQKTRFLCPAPGYDRHFSICQDLGIEMITIAMGPEGPDLDEVQKLVAEDASIKGIWCVPRYSNPTGIVYSDAVIETLAKMPTAANDFRIFWDNAYQVHHLTENHKPLKNILDTCRAAGNEDRVFIFGSTSKISFAGAGVSAMAASAANIDFIKKRMFMQTIGHDKLNQLRHIKFFENMDGIKAHMRKHAELLAPKFAAVDDILERELGGKDLATWSKPEGGYFVSLDTRDGLAKRVVTLADEAGVKLTGAGATFPYKKDPRNRNIRLAPSLPGLEEIRTAMEIVALAIIIASLEG